MRLFNTSIIILSFLFFAKLSVYCQSLSSEETVKYINDKLLTFGKPQGEYGEQIKLLEFGEIIIFNSHWAKRINLTKVGKIIYVSNGKMHRIRLLCEGSKNCVYDGDKKVWDMFTFEFSDKEEALKVKKAFEHLKRTGKKDPFSN